MGNGASKKPRRSSRDGNSSLDSNHRGSRPSKGRFSHNTQTHKDPQRQGSFPSNQPNTNGAWQDSARNSTGLIRLPTLQEESEEEEETPSRNSGIRHPFRRKNRPPSLDILSEDNNEERKEPSDSNNQLQMYDNPMSEENLNHSSQPHDNMEGSAQNKPPEHQLNQRQESQPLPMGQLAHSQPNLTNQANGTQSKPQNQEQIPEIHDNLSQLHQLQLPIQSAIPKLDPIATKTNSNSPEHDKSDLPKLPNNNLVQSHQNLDPNYHWNQVNNSPNQQQEPQIKKSEENKNVDHNEKPNQLPQNLAGTELAANHQNNSQNTQLHSPQKADSNEHSENSHSSTINQGSFQNQENKPIVPTLNLSNQQSHGATDSQPNPTQMKPNTTSNIQPLSISQPLLSGNQTHQLDPNNTSLSQSLNPKILQNQQSNIQSHPPEQQPNQAVNKLGLSPINTNSHQTEESHPNLPQNIKPSNGPQAQSNTQLLSASQQNNQGQQVLNPNHQDLAKSINLTQNDQSHSQLPIFLEKQLPAQTLKNPIENHNLSPATDNNKHPVARTAIGNSNQALQQTPQVKTNDPQIINQSQRIDPMHPEEKLANHPTQSPEQHNSNLQQQQSFPQRQKSLDPAIQKSQSTNPGNLNQKPENNPNPTAVSKDQPKFASTENSKLNNQSTHLIPTTQSNQQVPADKIVHSNSEGQNNLQVKPTVNEVSLRSPTIGTILSSQHSPETTHQTKPTPTYVKPVPSSNSHGDFVGIKPRFQKSTNNLSHSEENPKTISLPIPDKSKKRSDVAHNPFNLSQDNHERGQSPPIEPPNKKIMDYYSSGQSSRQLNPASHKELGSKGHSVNEDTKFYNPRHYTPPKQQPRGLPPLIIEPEDQHRARKMNFPEEPSLLLNHPLLHKPQSRASLTDRRSSKSSLNHVRQEAVPPQKPKPLQIHPQPPSIKSTNSKDNSPSYQRSRRAYPEDSIAGIFQNAPYDSQELLSTHTGSIWIPSPKSKITDAAPKLAKNMDYEYYNMLARGEYERQGEIPFKRPEQHKAGRSGDFHAEEPRGRHIRQPSLLHNKTSESLIEPSIRTGSMSDRIQPINANSDERLGYIDDLSYSLQDEHSQYNEFNGRLDTNNERMNIESTSPWRRQLEGTRLPTINSKPHYMRHAPQIFKRIDHYNPLIKETSNRNSWSDLVTNTPKRLQVVEPPDALIKPKFPKNEPNDYILKAESNQPSNKSPANTENFDFNYCMSVLTTDNTLHHLKSGHPLEFILNKAHIPNDRAKAKNLERGHHLRKPIHIKELVDQFLTSAKLNLREPFSFLEDLANEGNSSRPEFHNLLEINVEFFHYMGFYLQHERVLNYYDRWWNFPRDDEYIANLKDRMDHNAANLRRNINDLIWRKKDIQESEIEPWNYTRVWGGREIRAQETTQRYLKYLFTEAISKKSRGF